MATESRTMDFDEGKLNAFMQRAVLDMGAAMHAALVVVGDKLGLYKAMAGAGGLVLLNSPPRRPRTNAMCGNG